MPKRPALRVPSYRRHKPSGQAVVTLNGRMIYLGRYGSRRSRAEYDRLVGEWLAAGRSLPLAEADLTVAELAARYWRWAKLYYRDADGRPTRSLGRVRRALQVLTEKYAHTAAKDFGPLSLQAIQHHLVAAGAARVYVNYLIDSIRRAFKWAVAQQMIPETAYRALTAVAGLRRGRTEAPERPPVRPVPDEVIEATLPHLPPIVADMVRLHRLIGARPAEVCAMRPCDIDTSGEVWIYTPQKHKTEHHGHRRVILMGPRAQAIVRPYLLRPKDGYCFVPREGERKRRAELHERRKTPLSCGNRPGTNRRRRPKRQPGERYTPNTYAQAVARGVARANEHRGDAPPIPRWSPNQLRHSAATEIRKQFGIEAVQAILGHQSLNVSEIYAEKNLGLAAEVMRKIG